MEITTPLRALIIEDCDDDALLLVHTLKRGNFAPEFIRVDTKHDLSNALNQPWDIIFSDYTMPSFNGHEALAIVRNRNPDIPFFFVSGTIGEDRAVEVMRLGAQDYFIKGNLKRLSLAVHRELRDSVARRQQRLAEERIYQLANFDPLCGLPNRTRFIDLLDEQINTPNRVFAVFILNLDRFKDVNDHLGASTGDTLLIDLAQRLRSAVGPDDVVARLSGDEFAVLVNGAVDAAAAATAADKLLSVLTPPFSLTRYDWRMHASLGGSLFPQHGSHSSEIISNATMALHHAQQTQGTSYRMYVEGMRETLQQKVLLQRELEQALDQHEFKLHYQPQVRTRDGAIVGVEALIRWPRLGRNPSTPDEFIPLAEETGLIVPIGEWTLHTACKQMSEWRERGLSNLRIAVNFSAYQFRQNNLVDTVTAALLAYDLPASCLEVEITETTLMQDAGAAQILLSKLHDLGATIALDDFGTGYSSLSYLKRFPVDVLKIDRAFISDLPYDRDDAAIVQSIIAMAEKLKLQVIAEGVETAEQLEFLRACGCDMVQGYYLQRPAAADNLIELFQHGSVPYPRA